MMPDDPSEDKSYSPIYAFDQSSASTSSNSISRDVPSDDDDDDKKVNFFLIPFFSFIPTKYDRLVREKGGKVFAILGIVFSLIAGLAFVYYGKIVMDVMPDFVYFAENQDEIIADYDRDGTIPDRFDKYRAHKYDKYWEEEGFDSFDEFFDQFIKEYKRKNNINTEYDYNSGNGYSDLALGFQPALIL